MNDVATNAPIRIGVSSCLLGQNVRYDGGHKKDDFVTGLLGRFVAFVPICPEVEVGMSIPRPTIRLERRGEADPPGRSRRTASTTPRPWSAGPRGGSSEIEKLDLCGYVLKKDSPSCGMERVRVYAKGAPTRSGRGALRRGAARSPAAPPRRGGGAAQRPGAARELRRAGLRLPPAEGPLRRAVDAWATWWPFHTAEKLLLLAHDPDGYRQLGRIVAKAKETPRDELAARYGEIFMRAMAKPATLGKQANVLQHMAGYFKDSLPDDEKAELHDAIRDYRQRLVPLVVPLTLDPPPRAQARRRLPRGADAPRAAPQGAHAPQPRLGASRRREAGLRAEAAQVGLQVQLPRPCSPRTCSGSPRRRGAPGPRDGRSAPGTRRCRRRSSGSRPSRAQRSFRWSMVGERLPRRGAPLEDLLAPEHAQVVVDAPPLAQLALRGVPDLVVGAPPARASPGRRSGRAGRRRGPRASGWPRAASESKSCAASGRRDEHVEAQLPPGHELVEEGLGLAGSCPRIPPAFRASPGRAGPASSASRRDQGPEDLVGRDVAEVEPGREAARAVGVGVAALDVAREALGEEGAEDRASRDAPAACIGDGRRRRGRWEGRASAPGLPPRSLRRGPRPARGHLVGHRRAPPTPRASSGSVDGKAGSRSGQLRLEEPAEGVGGGEGGGREPHREEAVRRPPPRPGPGAAPPRRPPCAGRKKKGESSVTTTQARAASAARRPAPGARRGLDVGVVGDAGVGVGPRAVGHPLEDEGVEPVAGVRVAGAQRLEDQDGPVRAPATARRPGRG